MENRTSVTVFILVGLTEDPKLKIVLFIFLLLTYLLSISGNPWTIITLTLLDSHLKTPMYFFFSKFFLLRNFLYNSLYLKLSLLVWQLVTKPLPITAVQLSYFLLSFLVHLNFISWLPCPMIVIFMLPSVNSLHYTTIMSNKIWHPAGPQLLDGWFLIIFPGLILGLTLDFCNSNVIDHFYCDTVPLLQPCTDTHLIEILSFILALMTLLITLVLVILSYTYIALTIIKFFCQPEEKKAFSTCSSHMIVISFHMAAASLCM